jgi:hypothetical protein
VDQAFIEVTLCFLGADQVYLTSSLRKCVEKVKNVAAVEEDEGFAFVHYKYDQGVSVAADVENHR